MVDFFIYPSIFLALYFEVFIILGFFDSRASSRRGSRANLSFPSVSIIVPCHNEEKTVRATAESLKALDYPKDKLTIVLVNDGSTDGTKTVLDSFTTDPQIIVIHKEQGGKHTALNAGITATKSEFVGCLDADSFAEPKSLREVMAQFDDEKIGAVTSAMSVYEPKSILERMQHAEYLLGITLRHILSALNGLHVTPGPFTIFRRKTLEETGGFRSAHNTEDMEIALRIQKAGWTIQNAPQARIYTKAPRTVPGLVKQRVRWTSGFIRNAFDYRDLIANPRFGVLGLLVLPLGVFSLYYTLVIISVLGTEFAQWIWKFVANAFRVPLSFTFRVPTFELFFAPVSALSILAFIAITFTIVLIVTGARISGTKGRLGTSIMSYIAFYGLVAPLWTLRSIADVTLGVKRPWR